MFANLFGAELAEVSKAYDFRFGVSGKQKMPPVQIGKDRFLLRLVRLQGRS